MPDPCTQWREIFSVDSADPVVNSVKELGIGANFVNDSGIDLLSSAYLLFNTQIQVYSASVKRPDLKNSDGRMRKIGLELEFSGIELDEAAEIVRSLYGGEIRKDNRYRYKICDTELGDFEVELDARILQKMAASDILKEWGLDIDEQKLKDSIGDVLDKLAKTVVPLEIVMPPVPCTQLEKLEKLRKKLQQEKAEGTQSSWMNAFGLHMNVEVPNLEPETLIRYLKSFFILYPWLLEEMNIDLSRRLSPFIDPFPSKYVELVLDPGYHPSAADLLEDYLTYNPTRNRPLDMMPILASIDRHRVDETLEGEKNRPRPAFHYRLPNSHIEDSQWSFQQEWIRWLHLERLASDGEMLRKLSRLYLLRKKQALVSFRKEWAQTVSIMLDLDTDENT